MKAHVLFPFIALVVCIVVAAAAVPNAATDSSPAATTVTVDRVVEGRNVDEWRQRAIQMQWLAYARRLQNKDLRNVLRYDGTVTEAINLACTIYGNCATLWRKAGCETGGTFSPRSFNRGSFASGLFQFLPSTWRSTPFARFAVWSPYANALAAGWMHTHGRGGEWVCQ